MNQAAVTQALRKVRENIQQVVVGQHQAVDLLLIALVSRGHILLEDVPGIGKTTLASALARSLNLEFSRIQFTPDVMPSDVTGFNMYNPASGSFEFRSGAVMANIVLADEINRSSPKTQSALLEAMQDQQVTVDGTTYPLPSPFIVLATQNTIEQVGTYPLPEAQLDRFMIRMSLGYPTKEEEIDIYNRHSGYSPLSGLQPVIGASEILELQQAAIEVYIAPSLTQYVADVARATREHPDVRLGVSPRGALMLVQAVKGRALLQGRDYVLPEDVTALATYVFSHRIILAGESQIMGQTGDEIIHQLLRSIPVPPER